MTVRRQNARRSLVVGVTGHRNLDSRDPRLTHLVTRELRKITHRHDGAPLLVLTGLAEGADRLVTYAAQDLGSEFIAILPLPDALYEPDFSGAASLTDYESLRSNAGRVIRAPLMATRRVVKEYGEPRNQQYAWSGAYIAKRSQILIAIWDGAPARGTGGTAEVVGWFLANKTPPTYHISQAPRLSRRAGVNAELIHINPITLKVRRIGAEIR
jgi:hypothetical protein